MEVPSDRSARASCRHVMGAGKRRVPSIGGANLEPPSRDSAGILHYASFVGRLSGRRVYSDFAINCIRSRRTYVSGGLADLRSRPRVSGRGACAQIVGPTIRFAVTPKARRLGIVGAELVTEELAACSAPRLQFAVHDWQRLDAERTACWCVSMESVGAHQISPGHCLAKKIIPSPVRFLRTICKYGHNRVGRRRLSRKRHTPVENNNAHWSTCSATFAPSPGAVEAQTSMRHGDSLPVSIVVGD
jgi:hypothetical protein